MYLELYLSVPVFRPGIGMLVWGEVRDRDPYKVMKETEQAKVFEILEDFLRKYVLDVRRGDYPSGP